MYEFEVIRYVDKKIDFRNKKIKYMMNLMVLFFLKKKPFKLKI